MLHSRVVRPVFQLLGGLVTCCFGLSLQNGLVVVAQCAERGRVWAEGEIVTMRYTHLTLEHSSLAPSCCPTHPPSALVVQTLVTNLQEYMHSVRVLHIQAPLLLSQPVV